MPMTNPFQPVEKMTSELFMAMPDKFRSKSRTPWSDLISPGLELECFLEGPTFDREGNLWFVDIPNSRIFRITPKGDWELVTQYDGWPNGLKFHKDGRLFISDNKLGILSLDPKTGKIETVLSTMYGEHLKGVNDLHFASNGDLYFTDQGQTSITDPTGRVFRLRANGQLDCLASNVASPNGITLDVQEQHLYVAATRSQQIWKLPISAEGAAPKSNLAIQLTGGAVGPDGIAMDSEDGLLICHLGVGIWRFDSNMLPTHLIHSDNPQRNLLVNICFGGPDGQELYITESLQGNIRKVHLPFGGKKMFGLS